MRVKVGDVWYKAGPGRPVMVELTEMNKRYIAGMHEDAKLYAEFSGDDPLYPDPESMRRWMKEEGDMNGVTEREEKIIAHVNGSFGWHGGMGDPPDEDTVLAIVRGTLEYVEQESEPESEKEPEPEKEQEHGEDV